MATQDHPRQDQHTQMLKLIWLIRLLLFHIKGNSSRMDNIRSFISFFQLLPYSPPTSHQCSSSGKPGSEFLPIFLSFHFPTDLFPYFAVFPYFPTCQFPYFHIPQFSCHPYSAPARHQCRPPRWPPGMSLPAPTFSPPDANAAEKSAPSQLGIKLVLNIGAFPSINLQLPPSTQLFQIRLEKEKTSCYYSRMFISYTID